MFTHLLVPLDGSALAEEALVTACELAKKFGSRLTLTHVLVNLPNIIIPSEDITHDRMFDEIRRRSVRECRTYLEATTNRLQGEGFETAWVISEGRSAAQAILHTAEEQGVDGIVMSTHGRSGIRRWIFGSVTEKVLRNAQVPIVLLRSYAD